MPKSQIAYRQLPAKQRHKLRKLALATAPASLFGLSKYDGSLDAFSEWLTIRVIDQDKHGASLQVAGPACTQVVKATFQSGRVAFQDAYFLYLYSPEILSPVILSAFGLGFDEGRTVWAFALEDAATTDERFAKFLRLVKSSCRNCHLLDDGKVARVYQLNDTYFVEYVDLINHPGRVVVSSLESFLDGYHDPS